MPSRQIERNEGREDEQARRGRAPRHLPPARAVEKQCGEQRQPVDESGLVHAQAEPEAQARQHQLLRLKSQHRGDQQRGNGEIGAARVFGPAHHERDEQQHVDPSCAGGQAQAQEQDRGAARHGGSAEHMENRGTEQAVGAEQGNNAACQPAPDEADVEVAEPDRGGVIEQRRLIGQQNPAPHGARQQAGRQCDQQHEESPGRQARAQRGCLRRRHARVPAEGAQRAIDRTPHD